MVTQVRLRGGTQGRLRETKLMIHRRPRGVTTQVTGEAPDWSGFGRPGRVEGQGQGLYWGFCRKEKAGPSKQHKMAARVNNFSGLWAPQMVPSRLVAGPGMTKAQEYCRLGPVGQREQVGLWVRLYISGMSQAKHVAVSKN